jgi:hypothetical protein
MMSASPFRCSYELDKRLDRDLVTLNQELYRFIPQAPGAKVVLSSDDDRIPNAVDYYLVYVSALIHGAADAALTLTLHNLGREARLLERHVFECWIRAAYYVANPAEARLALLSTARQEKRLLDDLGYDKGSERYERVADVAHKIDGKFRQARTYREPTLAYILRQLGNEKLERTYAFMYRVPSQMAHASFNGKGGVITDEGISFDSREPLPNFGIRSVTACLIDFLSLLEEHFKLGVEDDLAAFKARWKDIESKISA